MQNRQMVILLIRYGLKLKVLEKAEKGQGLALKLSSLGLIKYQQPMKHTHEGIGIFPSLIVKYWTNGFTFL